MKYFGQIGFSMTVETTPGIWEEKIVERDYYGDLIKHGSRWEQSGEKINDNLILTNELSILADPFLYEHFSTIKYATVMGVKWKVQSIQVDRPRLTLNLGGVYNGD